MKERRHGDCFDENPVIVEELLHVPKRYSSITSFVLEVLATCVIP